MIKILTTAWGLFTHADIKTITSDDMAICDMLVIEEEVETYRESQISFEKDNWPFELTPEELSELKPTLIINDFVN